MGYIVSEAAHSYLNVSMLENDVVLCEPNRGSGGGDDRGGGKNHGARCYTRFVKQVWHKVQKMQQQKKSDLSQKH